MQLATLTSTSAMEVDGATLNRGALADSIVLAWDNDLDGCRSEPRAVFFRAVWSSGRDILHVAGLTSQGETVRWRRMRHAAGFFCDGGTPPLAAKHLTQYMNGKNQRIINCKVGPKTQGFS